MSAAVISFLVAISASIWAFTKLQNRAGYGNNRPAVTGAASIFAILFVVVFTVMHFMLGM